MNTNSKKIMISIFFLVGIVLTSLAIAFDITGSKSNIRGYILIIGILIILIALCNYPTKKHSKIINMVFLFPMLFTFFITVLFPFALGIIYSFTDWNGVEIKHFIGLKNYFTMFQQMDFVYSFLITLLFTIINMIMVNIVGFSLALLCTSKIRGKKHFSFCIFYTKLNWWNCIRLCMAVYFQQSYYCSICRFAIHANKS